MMNWSEFIYHLAAVPPQDDPRSGKARSVCGKWLPKDNPSYWAGQYEFDSVNCQRCRHTREYARRHSDFLRNGKRQTL